MPAKKWYQSKTLWIAVLQGVSGTILALSQTGDIKNIGVALMVKTFIDTGIRLLTNQPLTQ